MAKQRVCKINLNRTFEEKTVDVDANQLKVGKEDEVTFFPSNVFTEAKKSRLKFWRGNRSLVFFVDGAVKALSFSEVTDLMQTLWTKKEATEHTKKQVAKARVKFKPMTWGQVILLAVLIIVLIVINLYGLTRRF